ncbi:MAG: tetratricopeptide repeat protein [Gemmatimonadaceae bacterium]
MSNVAKLKKQAAEFEQKKQFDRALAKYVQVLDELGDQVDETDVALYNRVGDLMLRQGSVGEAVDYYEKAVDLYSQGGFFNNAIALCNKILRSAPGRNSIYYKLGRISAQKGFVNDAKQNFLEYADRMQKVGELEEAFRALREFADLCPDQDDIRLMLADQLVRKDRKEEAIEQLHTLYEKFQAEGRTREARATVDRMRAIDPAVETQAPPTWTPTPKSTDLIFLDVNYDGPLDQPFRGIQGLPAKPPLPTPPRPSYVLPGDTPPAAAPPQDTGAPEITGTPSANASAPPEQSSPASTPALSDMPAPQFEEAEEPGLTYISDDAPPHDSEDVSLLPSAEANSGDNGDRPAAGEVADLMTSEDFITGFSEPAAGWINMDRDERPLISRGGVGDDSFEQPAETTASESDPDIFLEELEGVGEMEGVPVVSEYSHPPEPEPAIPEPQIVSSTAASGAEVAEVSRIDRVRELLSDNRGDWSLHEEFGELLIEEGDRELGLEHLDTAMDGFAHDGDIASASSVLDTILRIDPNSVKYHQKRVELSVRASDRGRLVLAYLDLADCLLRAGQMPQARSVYSRVVELAPADERAMAGLQLTSEPEPAADEPRESEVESRESGVEFRESGVGSRESTEAEATTEAPEPVHAPSRPTPVPRAAAELPAAAADEEFVNLAEWLRDEDSPKSTRMVVDVAEPRSTEQADFSEMLSMFKEGVAANVDEADHESHYDLGVAYKEMGLLDEAIAEFQKALRGSASRVRTYEALGQCFVEKKQFQIALTILSRALTDQRCSDDMLVGILYLLGYASEQVGAWNEALGYYRRVFAVEIEFRDVKQRLATVESRLE